jgi:SOS-response transcriptional repressor LexA
MSGLTVREADLVNFLKDWEKKNDFGPSFDNMKAGLNLSSKCSIHRLVKGLQRKNIIEYETQRARTIKLKRQQTKAEILGEVLGRLGRPDCQTARNIVMQMLTNEELKDAPKLHSQKNKQ